MVLRLHKKLFQLEKFADKRGSHTGQVESLKDCLELFRRSAADGHRGLGQLNRSYDSLSLVSLRQGLIDLVAELVQDIKRVGLISRVVHLLDPEELTVQNCGQVVFEPHFKLGGQHGLNAQLCNL